MKIKLDIASLLFMTLLSSCSFDSVAGKPELYKKHFDFYKIGNSLESTSFEWTMEFKNKDRKLLPFNNCNEIAVFNHNDLALFDQFRFKLFTADCTAIYKYLNAKEFKQSFFPTTLSDNFIVTLPAHITPIINNYIFKKQRDKTLEQAYNILTIQKKNKSTNILTKTDEFYIDILARGDFDDDGFEDLLVSSQWYARNARGKYNDLVILSKTGKDKAIEVIWRIHGANWQ